MWTSVNDIDTMFGAMDLLRSRMNRLFTEVPGLSKDELNIKIQGNYLELNGSRKSEIPESQR